jgi:hypothetical protein
MACERPQDDPQEDVLSEGFEYPPMDPTLIPDKAKDWRGALWPCNDVAPEGGEPPDPELELLPGERLWMEGGVEWVQRVLRQDWTAFQQRLAEDAKSHVEVARAKEEACRAMAEAEALVARFHETPPEQHPELVTQIQGQLAQTQRQLVQIGQSNSWGTVNQHDVQGRVEVIIRCLAPHAEAGAKMQAVKRAAMTVIAGRRSGMERRKKVRPRNEEIKKEIAQARLTQPRGVGKKKKELETRKGISKRQLDRILKDEDKRTS